MTRAAAGISVVAVVAGGISAYAVLDTSPPPPPPASGDRESASFARYFFRGNNDAISAHGVLEVDADPESVCYQVTTRDVTASHLVGTLPAEEGEVPNRAQVLLTFFEPENTQGATAPPGSGAICLRGEELGEMEGQLQVLINEPLRFKIDFHGPGENEPALEAELVPQGTELRKPDEECGPPPVRPTYLPWLEEGERVPRPRDSYDDEIERFQQSWEDPRSEDGGVGLSIYPLPNGTDGGERTDAYVHGVEGRLHHGEGGSISISWSLDALCNFLELSIFLPETDRDELERELLKVARSLESISDNPSLSAELEDGRHFGYIERLDDNGDALIVDVAEFLAGEEAQRAAEDAGYVNEGEPVPNDYYISNVNPRLRRLLLGEGVAITLSTWDRRSIPNEKEVSLEMFQRIFSSPRDWEERVTRNGYWFTVVNGKVVELEEQYVP